MVRFLRLSALMLFACCISVRGQNKIDLLTSKAQFEAKEVPAANVYNGITRNIIQDKKGNIWLATFGGVFRYDGKTFTNITDKVSSARFFSILEDKKGSFWFGSIGSGVYYYNPSADQTSGKKSFQNFTSKQGLAGNSVQHIYEDKAGNIWFGTQTGISLYNGKTFQNYQLNPKFTDDNDVNSMVQDKTGKFWIGTRGSAYTFDGEKFSILTDKGESFTNVRTIMQDKKGNIWLSGNDGLWRYDGSTFTNFTRNFVGYVHEDRSGNIWTSSQPDYTGNDRWALSRYERNSLSGQKPSVTNILTDYEVYNGMVFGILAAQDGSIWFGALDGVRRFDGKSITYFKEKE